MGRLLNDVQGGTHRGDDVSKTSKSFKAKRGCLGFLIAVLLFGFGITLTVAAATQAILLHFGKGLPDVSTLSYYEPAQTTKIFSSDGQLIGTLFKENRTWTPLDQISPHLIRAVLAIEDSRFYEHRGVDPVGVIRAALAEKAGGGRQGASTITMQLARNLFLTPKPTLDRKLKEVLLAIQIEKTYTKDEILELYLNQIYFGAGAYGVHAASEQYFGKRPKALTPAEASLIAGLPQAPSEYSPLVDENAARQRQTLVLGRMVDLGYLTWKEYRQAVHEARVMKFRNKNREEFTILKVPYFTTYVIKQLYKRYDEDLIYRGGLKIYTTVDLSSQRKAEELVKKLVARDREILNVHTGALVCIENGTGFIRAMVGGTEWTQKNQFNRAWQARRQPGSSFKIFVYTTAVESGYGPDTVVPDTPVNFGEWSPKNSDGRFMGAIPLQTALQYSRNVVAVKMLNQLGPERVIEYAHAMGIKEELNPYLSLALGAADISPLEMADAFSTIPNQGIRVPATPIKIIYDRDGNVVEDHRFPQKTEVLAESTASIMMTMMRAAVVAGTGGNAYIEKHETAGKTGTTDSFRDAWFVGYSRDYTTAVWVGNDDFAKMWHSFGGDLPATIWREFMTYQLRNVKESKLPITKPDKFACLLCADSKMRAGPKCPKVIRKLYARYAMPRQFCDRHGRPQMPLVGPTDTRTSVDKTPPKPAEKAPQQAVTPNFDNPADIPVPTQVVLPTEVPMTAPEPVPTEPPAFPAVDVPEVAPQPVELPPPPEPVVIPVEIPVTPVEPPPPPAPPPSAPPLE